MKFKRALLVISLLALFIICYRQMDTQYDPFARYSYITDENEDIIRQYIVDPDDIEYIISQKIKPEQFMDFITLPGFVVKNTLYYEMCLIERPADKQFIVDFVNSYRKQLNGQTFDSLIRNYTYASLSEFYDNGYNYIENAELVADPSLLSVIIAEDETILDYRPTDLVSVDTSVISSASSIAGEEVIYLREEVIEPLKDMMEAMKEEKNVDNNFILTNGFVSYEMQIEIYKQALKKYGDDTFSMYSDYPGRSEYQLGYMLTLKIPGVDNVTQIEASAQYKWLKDNAHKYGFIIRYPKDKEKATGKVYQPLTLRYVGEANALEVYESQNTFNEIEAKDE
ncbi:D-alanyl-D-alanine carboxypeptidase [Breznakia sp. PF5-3]|uniref:M15 family metallopeptidase n=1 Tax=unclassified Breznakia TaxID=2623764 RepID=UPI0024058756|nr:MULTISPECIES: M15 family metallopeptidase [unclassified Breznakia]MDF9823737.1 D-alanyl-D-alanine carboxypeptidase [Breznakia sp. PM6-1]MDF9834535.1 D-alanyl-D-alanine carboxypeptidase [Breznakia sp. PF5-3]MDF9838709.1 D-alanyl-D-alanine carboxypeptidase [Breznakia sp. PFB2-8]MDF9860740.1 D-alanyl-D-alanine carboxypeptidase [Breznakia sp. PH5-24]